MFESVQKIDPLKSICLGCWLTKPHPEYSGIIEELRSCSEKDQRKIIKAKLPAITPSGVFKDRLHLEKYSGLACIDIDGQDNPHILNWNKAKKTMRSLMYIGYAGLSCGGNGLVLLVRIKEYENHKELFNQIEKDLLLFGLYVDPSKKGGNDMRYYSVDLNPYINERAVFIEPARKQIQPLISFTKTPEFKAFDIAGDLKTYIERFIQNQSRIFDYNDWLRLGIALVNEFGEEGREYFHQLSEPDPRYNNAKCEKMYNDLMNRKYTEITGGTIKHLLQQVL